MEDILKHDGEHLEPNVLLDATTLKPNIMSTSEVHVETSNSYKYDSHIWVFVLLLLLYRMW